MKASEEQIALWQEKYGVGNIAELHYEGRFCYLTDPSLDLHKMKILIGARRKSVGALVDAMVANCWLGGDEEFKTDEALKQGIEDQVDDIMELPDHETTELENGNVSITVNDFTIEVRKATRNDLRYAEDRDKDNKPLVKSIFLLERLAVDAEVLKVLRSKVREYLSVLFAIQDLKDKKRVEVKKL